MSERPFVFPGTEQIEALAQRLHRLRSSSAVRMPRLPALMMIAEKGCDERHCVSRITEQLKKDALLDFTGTRDVLYYEPSGDRHIERLLDLMDAHAGFHVAYHGVVVVQLRDKEPSAAAMDYLCALAADTQGKGCMFIFVADAAADGKWLHELIMKLSAGIPLELVRLTIPGAGPLSDYMERLLRDSYGVTITEEAREQLHIRMKEWNDSGSCTTLASLKAVADMVTYKAMSSDHSESRMVLAEDLVLPAFDTALRDQLKKAERRTIGFGAA